MRAYILPHPPIAVPEVGGEEIHKIEATEEALIKLRLILQNTIRRR